MPTLKINSSYQSKCMDNLLVVEIDNLAASTIGGGAATGVAASATVNVGDKSSEHPLSRFFKQKFDGRQGIYDYHRSLLDYLFAR
jgi:hypothetical protein